MAPYVILSLAVLAVILAAAWLYKSGRRAVFGRSTALALGILLLLTLVFDNLIIWAGIVAYDPVRISGLYLGRAPVEDLSYTVGAALLVPLLWTRFGTAKRRDQVSDSQTGPGPRTGAGDRQ